MRMPRLWGSEAACCCFHQAVARGYNRQGEGGGGGEGWERCHDSEGMRRDVLLLLFIEISLNHDLVKIRSGLHTD